MNLLAPGLALMLVCLGHGWWALGLLATAHAFWLLPTLWPACDWCGEVLTQLPGHGGGKEIWLTIDDGPDETDTPLLLDLLEAHQAKATFFFIGTKAGLHPELVRNVLSGGHEIGNHTLTHPQFLFWAYAPEPLRKQILWAQRVLSEVSAGRAPRWFRAPAGLKNPLVHAILERNHLRYVAWSARGFDGVHADKKAVLERLQRAIKPGAIVLMHEGRVDAEGRRLAPQVLADLLKWLDQQGYACVLPP